MNGTPRTARIVLVTPNGRLLGVLPPVAIASPWWQHVEDVVDAVRTTFGIEIIVLRLLSADRLGPHGGEVTYLAETSLDVATEGWNGALDEHPLRQAYAKLGGPTADLDWVYSVLASQGFVRSGPAIQVRTWNLSSLWRIPVEGETLWLKAVPPFFGHEGALIGAMKGGSVPDLVGSDCRRILMHEIPGVDGYSAELPVLLRMIDLLVGRQAEWIQRKEELLGLGLPDWRADSLTSMIRATIAKYAKLCPREDAEVLEMFAIDLPERFAQIDECGIPDTLVHGDFHPGNVRINGEQLTLIDWGDSGAGHPLLDQSAFFDDQPPEDLPLLRERWSAAWKAVVPGSDPDRASALLNPIAAARRAAIYDGFLLNIEPSEHPYHATDPVTWLRNAAALTRV